MNISGYLDKLIAAAEDAQKVIDTYYQQESAEVKKRLDQLKAAKAVLEGLGA